MTNVRQANIGFIIDGMGFGGAERQLTELLKGINREAYSPSLICFRQSQGFTDQVTMRGVPVYYALRKWRWDLSVVWKLALLIKKHRLSLLHTFMPLAGTYGALAARSLGIPIVNFGIRNTERPSLYQAMIFKVGFGLSTVVAANSKAGRQVYQWVCPRKEIRIVNNGIDLNRFDTPFDGEKLRRELGFERFKYIVTAVNRLEPEKNPSLLVDAASLVLKQEPDTAFLIIGEGTLKASLEKQIRDNGLGANVFLLGPRKDVENILTITDIGVLTSDREGLSNAIIEMLASGVPVVATATEGTKEVFEDGAGGGLLVGIGNAVETSEAISKLLNDEPLRRELAAKGKATVADKFDVRRMVTAVEDIYRELLEKE